jgi:4-amino-4-deoxy-L-arabinose transferase-like glycosyltransferase
VLLVAIACALVFVSLRGSFRELERTPYFNDESRWINRADFLKEALHPFSSFWEDRYIVRAQPPMGSYIIGLGLLAQGRSLDTNGPWIFEYGFSPDISWNVIGGAMPSRADLFAARRTNAIAGAIAVVSLFLLVTEFTNWFGGLFGALFLAVNPLQLYLSSLGVSDELFMALFALSALAALYFARAPSWPRALLLGLLIGMGTSTKLSPIFVGFALAAFGAALVIQPLINRLPKIGTLWRAIPGTNAPNSSRVGWMLAPPKWSRRRGFFPARRSAAESRRCSESGISFRTPTARPRNTPVCCMATLEATSTRMGSTCRWA